MSGKLETKLSAGPEAPHSCNRCPRLVAYRQDNQRAEPGWFNGPVPSFGKPSAQLLIVGLAPGRNGANRTGRPFTGDYAGDLLYATLLEFGFARGTYEARPDDGLTLANTMITNAVRCVPPQNKPTPEEITTCRPFLKAGLKPYRNSGSCWHSAALPTIRPSPRSNCEKPNFLSPTAAGMRSTPGSCFTIASIAPATIPTPAG